MIPPIKTVGKKPYFYRPKNTPQKKVPGYFLLIFLVKKKPQKYGHTPSFFKDFYLKKSC